MSLPRTGPWRIFQVRLRMLEVARPGRSAAQCVVGEQLEALAQFAVLVPDVDLAPSR